MPSWLCPFRSRGTRTDRFQRPSKYDPWRTTVRSAIVRLPPVAGGRRAGRLAAPVERDLAFMLRLFVIGPLPTRCPPRWRRFRRAHWPAAAEWTRMPLPGWVSATAWLAHVSRGYLNRLFRTAFGLSAAAAPERAHAARGRVTRRTPSPSRSSAHSVGSPTRATSPTGLRPSTASHPAPTGCGGDGVAVGARPSAACATIHLLWG